MSSTLHHENLYYFAARLLFKHSILDTARIKYHGHSYRMNKQCQRVLRMYYIGYILFMNLTVLISVRLLMMYSSLSMLLFFLLLAIPIFVGSMPYFLRFFLPLHDRAKLIEDILS